jgi:hypothetical protein
VKLDAKVKELVPKDADLAKLLAKNPLPSKEHVEKYMLLKYLFHYRDHTSKHTVLKFLPNKTASSVCHALVECIDLFGASEVLQNDNGTEFVAEVVKNLVKSRSIVYIQGRPYHPQSQGCVEQANGSAKSILHNECYTRDLPPNAAACFVGKAMLSLNSRVVTSIKMSSFEYVFGVQLRDPTMIESHRPSKCLIPEEDVESNAPTDAEPTTDATASITAEDSASAADTEPTTDATTSITAEDSAPAADTEPTDPRLSKQTDVGIGTRHNARKGAYHAYVDTADKMVQKRQRKIKTPRGTSLSQTSKWAAA